MNKEQCECGADATQAICSEVPKTDIKIRIPKCDKCYQAFVVYMNAVEGLEAGIDKDGLEGGEK